MQNGGALWTGCGYFGQLGNLRLSPLRHRRRGIFRYAGDFFQPLGNPRRRSGRRGYGLSVRPGPREKSGEGVPCDGCFRERGIT